MQSRHSRRSVSPSAIKTCVVLIHPASLFSILKTIYQGALPQMRPVQSFATVNTHRNPGLNTRAASSNNQEREEILPMLEDVNLEDISTRILTSVAIPTSPRKTPPRKKRSVPYTRPSASGQQSTRDSFKRNPGCPGS